MPTSSTTKRLPRSTKAGSRLRGTRATMWFLCSPWRRRRRVAGCSARHAERTLPASFGARTRYPNTCDSLHPASGHVYHTHTRAFQFSISQHMLSFAAGIFSLYSATAILVSLHECMTAVLVSQTCHGQSGCYMRIVCARGFVHMTDIDSVH